MELKQHIGWHDYARPDYDDAQVFTVDQAPGSAGWFVFADGELMRDRVLGLGLGRVTRAAAQALADIFTAEAADRYEVTHLRDHVSYHTGSGAAPGARLAHEAAEEERRHRWRDPAHVHVWLVHPDGRRLRQVQ